jgi:hypothetical protein
MLILGGAATIQALSGIDTVASAFLIPVGVMFYTAHGGLKATFLASWFNTAVIMIAMCIFIFSVYGTPNSELGSPSKVYDNLTVVGKAFPVKGNREGSYLTMFSESGIIFGIINIIGAAARGMRAAASTQRNAARRAPSLPPRSAQSRRGADAPFPPSSTTALGQATSAPSLLISRTGRARSRPSPRPRGAATCWAASAGSPSPSPWRPPWAWAPARWRCPSPPTRPTPA